MDSSHGRPPTRRRRALQDATLRANEDHRARSPRHGDKLSPRVSTGPLPHNESLEANGTLAVRHPQPSPSPHHKRLSAVIDEGRPRRSKRDSEISNASTNASNGGRRKTHIGPWQLGKTIGRGGCSRVRAVRHSSTGQYGAAKIISKATADKVRALSLANLANSVGYDSNLVPGSKFIPFGLEREICIMKLLDHPNIVHLYDIWENRNELYLIMEYVEGGELFSYLSEHGALPEIEVVHIFRQIIAALLYCHRINIHHRDLKPENILLDRETMQIKLVDFGMAALQPLGKKLTTPCGSPHYAAPEVISMRPYDGGKADVWSSGVILFLMLTGSPPFNYSGDDDQLVHLFRAISRADYVVPNGLSREAHHLIRKMLTVEPKKRISIEEIWNHKFLHKYDEELDNLGDSSSMECWVGPQLQLRDWQRLTSSTIDREILRYMRTLWHSEPEEVLVTRLTNNEVNYEKYFYSVLQQYQQDQLENYVPSAHRPISYSSSDYHHNGRSYAASVASSGLPPQKHKRSQSGYSILHDEHLYSKHSFHTPPSDASYDPFRASREPIIPSQVNQRNVTVHRGLSSDTGSRRLRPTTALGHHTGSSLRIRTLRQNSKRSSAVSRNSSKRSNPSQRTGSVRHESVSRSSLGSSHWNSSPAVAVRTKSFKRGVSFPNVRRPSAITMVSADTSGVQYTPQQSVNSRRGCESAISSNISPRPSTVGDSPSVRPLPKTARKPNPRLRLRKPESPSKYINSEARKVSTELEKVMDEAFNRSSVGSSMRASMKEKYQDGAEYDTPPTSISNRDSGGTTLATPREVTAYQNRPLPPTPNETPNTFLQRKLAETRAEIAQRFADKGEDTENISLVLDKLDRLMVPPPNTGLRVCSAPSKTSEQPGPLHVIPEEVKAEVEERFERPDIHSRVLADPIRPSLQFRRAVTDQNVDRLVDRSTTRIAPLNIRKKSGASTSTRGDKENTAACAHSLDRPTAAQQGDQNDSRSGQSRLEPPSLTTVVPEPRDTTLKKKKSSWFRRNPEEKDRTQDVQPKPTSTRLEIPERWYGLDDRIKYDLPKISGPSLDVSKQATRRSDDGESSEFPMRNCGSAFSKNEGSGGLKGFFGLFGRKTKEEKGRRALELGDNFSTSSIISGFESESDGGNPSHPGPVDFQMNWLSRFLHIKPASKILCFEAKRGRVRQLLVRQLQAWEQGGIKDVSCNNNMITARIDKVNHLHVKPVSFVIELFVVLQNGRRAHVCLARFTQTQGAASGFRKALDHIEMFYRAQGILVEDEKKKAAMCEVLN